MTSILKNKNTQGVLSNTAYIGTNVSESEVAFLSLLCVANGHSKTKLIRAIFSEWYEKNYSKDKAKECIVTISDDAYETFKTEGIKKFTGKKSAAFIDFVEILKGELLGKGLSQKYASLVATRLMKLYEADKGK